MNLVDVFGLACLGLTVTFAIFWTAGWLVGLADLAVMLRTTYPCDHHETSTQ